MPMITVNGKLFAVQPARVLSFRVIADLAGFPEASTPSMTLRQRRKRDQAQPEGRIVHPADSFDAVDGMVFSVYDTGNA